MRMDKVEFIARAIAVRSVGSSYPYLSPSAQGEMVNNLWQNYRETALAALAAADEFDKRQASAK